MSNAIIWIWAFFNPANLLVLMLLLGLLLMAIGRRKKGVVLVCLSTVVFVIIAITPVTRLMLSPLENRFARPENVSGPIRGIIVLGGISNAWISYNRRSLDVNASGDRLIETVALARRFPEAEIWLLGRHETKSIMRILAALGVPRDRIKFENTSKNTYQNLALAKPVAKPGCREKWILVTSAWHMPRAIAVARSLEWPVIAFPTDYRTIDGQARGIKVELAETLVLFNSAVKEWLGLLVYRLRGWTREIWPKPGLLNTCGAPPPVVEEQTGRVG